MRKAINLKIQTNNALTAIEAGILVLANESLRVIEFREKKADGASVVEFLVEADDGLSSNFGSYLVNKYRAIVDASVVGGVELLSISSPQIDKDIKQYATDITSNYKKINSIIDVITQKYDSGTANFMLKKIGFAIGKWQYSKNYSRGNKLSFYASVKRMLIPAIKDFCPKTVLTNNIIECEKKGVPSAFISSFTEGFMSGLTHLETVDLKVSSNESICRLEIVNLLSYLEN